VLTRTELIAGSRSHQERALAPLLRWISWIDVDQAIADEAGSLIAGYRASHGGIDIVDYVIAATANVRGAALWTTNRRHFPMLGELPDPYEPV
jgi:predicted nucleic acid-binding protein